MDKAVSLESGRPLVGVFTGLLANGGEFLIVPLYLLIFGLTIRQAVGTSMLVITVLAIPTLIIHWTLRHISWALAPWEQVVRQA